MAVPRLLPGGRLLNNIIWCAHLSASVLHDKVFAIRAISQIEGVESLRPDYGSPIIDLWIRVATHLLSQEPQTSVVLSLACTREFLPWERVKGLPSWVPNFGQLGRLCRDRYRQFCRTEHWQHAIGRPSLRFDEFDKNVIYLPAEHLFDVRRAHLGHARRDPSMLCPEMPPNSDRSSKTIGHTTFRLDRNVFTAREWAPRGSQYSVPLPRKARPRDEIWL